MTTVEKIIQACVCLHNYLRQTENASYTTSGFIDAEDGTGNISQGHWRSTINDDDLALQDLPRLGWEATTIHRNQKK